MDTATEVRERPILFSGEMVRAILDGRKTQTRRVVKLPEHVVARGIHPRMDEWVSKGNRYTTGSGQYQGGNPLYTGDQPPGLLVTCLDDTCQRVPCPYGQPGDRLYVRETWHKIFEWPEGHNERLLYRADGHDLPPGHRWKPSIHMPKRFSRIWLEVTGVRVERVQDITEEDAVAEGVQMNGPAALTDRTSFAHLWDSINARRGYSWESNCWVWVVEFTCALPTSQEDPNED